MENEIGSACSTNGENRNAVKILVGKPVEKGPLGRPRRKWEDRLILKLILDRMGSYGLN
jgi:hypothetical protein